MKKNIFSIINNKRGSILLFAMFIVVSLSFVAVTYWKLIEYYTKSIDLKGKRLQAFQLARAGVEDAIYEIKNGVTWQESSLGGHGWAIVSGNTFSKSKSAGSLNPDLFNYPATFSVTVSGDASINTVNIISTGEISSTDDVKYIKRTLNANVVRTTSGEIYIINMQEI